MSKVNNAILTLLTLSAQAQMDNPDLFDFMNSSEEQERMDQMFKDLVGESNEHEKDESKN